MWFYFDSVVWPYFGFEIVEIFVLAHSQMCTKNLRLPIKYCVYAKKIYVDMIVFHLHKNVVQYKMFKMTKENGKKKRENLSIYNAVSLPLQNVSYCGGIDGRCSMDFR